MKKGKIRFSTVTELRAITAGGCEIFLYVSPIRIKVNRNDLFDALSESDYLTGSFEFKTENSVLIRID